MEPYSSSSMSFADEEARLQRLLDAASATSEAVDRVFAKRGQFSPSAQSHTRSSPTPSPPTQTKWSAAPLPAWTPLQVAVHRPTPSPPPIENVTVSDPAPASDPLDPLRKTRTERARARIEREYERSLSTIRTLERENEELRCTCDELRTDVDRLRRLDEARDREIAQERESRELERAAADEEARERWAHAQRVAEAERAPRPPNVPAARMDGILADEQNIAILDLQRRLTAAEAERERLRTLLMGVAWHKERA